MILEEALNIVYADNVNVIVTPRRKGPTDEDSGNENGEGTVENLSRNQLNANIGIQMYEEELKDGNEMRKQAENEECDEKAGKGAQWCSGCFRRRKRKYERRKYFDSLQ